MTTSRLNFMTAALAAATALPILAEVETRTVEYRVGDVASEGYLAIDTSKEGPRPAVLIVHQWMGIIDHERDFARELAAKGHVAFCADIYGKENRPANRQEAGAQAGRYRGNRALFRERLNGALAVLREMEGVDKDRIAAIGFCFGGTGVLELARSGAEVAGVVSFHGSLDSPTPEDGKNIKAKVLVLHGADDPVVSPENIAAMQKEFRDAKVDWQMIYYAGAVHSFTQESAGNDPSTGSAFHPDANRRARAAMHAFFAELFGPPD